MVGRGQEGGSGDLDKMKQRCLIEKNPKASQPWLVRCPSSHEQIKRRLNFFVVDLSASLVT